jgi:hypothetical protein
VTNASEAPKSETDRIDGHVITVECLFHEDSKRWEPVVLVRPSWRAGEAAVRVATTAEHFQDTPQDALAFANTLARQWLVANAPSDDGTVDAAV